MAILPIKPGRTEGQLTARGRASLVPPQVLSVPGGLHPLMSAAFEVDEYRLLSGWPVPVPDGDIRIECLVSAEGDVLADRETPTSVLTAADMRWVADTDFYDQTALLWRPIQGDAPSWQTSPDHAPTLVTDYEYTIGDQRFTSMTVMNFDSNTEDYLWNDLGLHMGGTTGYTVIMVLSPNSIYGNDEATPENALWSPDQLGPDPYMMFTFANQSVYLRTESLPAQKGVAIGDALSSTTPHYLALVVGRPTTVLYAGSGPSKVLSKALPSGGIPESLSTRFWLGSSPSPTVASMNMALLDLGMYGNLLTRSQVVAEFSSLSRIYGGD